MDKIIALLKNEGVHPSCMLADSLDNANRGKPTTFHISSDTIGRCYTNYREVVVNYDANMERHPANNGGRVRPRTIKDVEGITVATFDYNVDSGD